MKIVDEMATPLGVSECVRMGTCVRVGDVVLPSALPIIIAVVDGWFMFSRSVSSISHRSPGRLKWIQSSASRIALSVGWAPTWKPPKRALLVLSQARS